MAATTTRTISWDHKTWKVFFLLSKRTHTIQALQSFNTNYLRCDALYIFHSFPYPSMISELKRLFTFWFVHFFCRLLRDYLLEHEPSFRFIVCLAACSVGWLVGWCVRLLYSLLCSQYTHTHTRTHGYQMKNARNSMKVLWIFHGCTFLPYLPPDCQIAHRAHGTFNYDNECFIPRNKQM